MQNTIFISNTQIKNYLISKFDRWVQIFEHILLVLSVSSINTSITGFFVAYVSHILLGVTPSIKMCTVFFLGCFSIYSLDKIVDLKKDLTNMPQRNDFISGKIKQILVCAITAYVLCLILVFMENPLAVPILFIPMVINAAYSSKIIPGFPRLKDLPATKNLSVALCWGSMATFLSATQIDIISYGTMIWIVLYFIAVKIFINTDLYDIRDAKGDTKNGVKTIPIVLGPTKTTIFLLFLNTTLWPLLIFVDGEIRFLMMALILYGYAYILYFKTWRKPVLYDLFINGEWMFACILYTLT